MAAMLARIGLVLLLAAAVATTAGAHESETGHRLSFRRVEPATPGLIVEVAQEPAPTIRVSNRTEALFEPVGADGVPFLRIGPDGVEANVASPDFYRSESASPAIQVPVGAQPGAPPRFVRIASGSDWAWFEHRLTAPEPWSVPARLAGREIRLTGVWTPVERRGSFVAVLERVRPEIDRLRIALLPGRVPGLFVDNRTGQVLVVPGEDGRRFLRIGPRRTELADASGAWRQVSDVPVWAWAEPRAGWPRERPPASVARSSEVTTVRRWTLRARLGEEPVRLEGRVEWVPVASHHEDGDGGPLVVPVLAGGLLVLAAVTLLARRRAGTRSRTSNS